MEENHQDNVENKLKSTENKTRLLPSEPEDEKGAQKELVQLRKRLSKKEKGAFKSTRNWTGFKGKTLWDWLQLLGILAIPIVVAGATLFFGIQQAHLADVQHQQDQQNTLNQQQAAILQTYIDNIQDLLLNHKLRTTNPNENDPALLAKARTLTALQVLDPERKGILVQFIYSAKLIGFLNPVSGDPTKGTPEPPIIHLAGANLSDAILYIKFGSSSFYADFNAADFNAANLTDANLYQIYLVKADLSNADLTDAVLTDDVLYDANLSDANLSGANLSGANLSGANLAGTDFTNVTWSNTTCPDTTNSDTNGSNSCVGH